ncbi:Twin-arginine translocation protein TatB [Alloactinosynnema sp. L-07]|uniref:Sec-independent protein translocase protein TatB n=1 Tax=Alloactinosynnema sp. L-07 TaxID=1653480 RepID=UPI00065F04EE|nr:Sec-independent protein translocase protein TatB [Alloactinosynnema sp. L-07]CRK61717.1 Twin-arginine translocation protein TatB [Alloactinosynnema sp. L-07]
MFESIGWAEILVLGVAGLFILGPERLPDAAAWVGKTMRKVREYATGARDQLKTELGPEYDDLRKPLNDLRQLRSLDPKQMVANHLFGDGENGVKPNGYAPQPALPPAPAPADPPKPAEKPAFDPDAT